MMTLLQPCWTRTSELGPQIAESDPSDRVANRYDDSYGRVLVEYSDARISGLRFVRSFKHPKLVSASIPIPIMLTNATLRAAGGSEQSPSQRRTSRH